MLEKIIEIDINILLWIQEYIRNDFLTYIFKFITMLGNYGAFWIILCLVLLIVRKYRVVGIVSSISLMVTFILDSVLKNIVARERPFNTISNLQCLITHPTDYSFPSGHTACSFAVVIVLYLMLPKKIGIPAIFLAILIGISRIYLGVHYLSDVIGGTIIGTLVALITYLIYKKVSNKNIISKAS